MGMKKACKGRLTGLDEGLIGLSASMKVGALLKQRRTLMVCCEFFAHLFRTVACCEWCLKVCTSTGYLFVPKYFGLEACLQSIIATSASAVPGPAATNAVKTTGHCYRIPVYDYYAVIATGAQP